jgi:hypothetical protein
MSNSIGNLKNSGLQGNNFPWQLKMLEGLQAIYNEVKKPLTCVEDGVTICGPTDGLNVNLHDGLGTPITSTPNGLGNTGIDVNIIGGVTLEVNLDPDNDSVGMYGYTDINDPLNPTAILVNSSGQLDIRPLTCADKVSLCFNDGVSDLTVSTTNPLPVSVTETNDSIQIYASDSVNNVPVLVGQQDCSDSLAVTLCTQQAGVQITPNIQVSINDIATITDPVYSISFANIGTADALVSFDSGLTTVPLSPGVTVNMDAGGLGNFYASATFAWDTQSNLGSKLVITYNT